MDLRRDGSNYFVINACDMRDGCGGGKDGEGRFAKFRVDLEYDVATIENRSLGHWYVTVPVRFVGFWDLFDVSDGATSSPFVEMNYSPGLELSLAPWLPPASRSHRHRLVVSSGARHESNGVGFYRRNGADLAHLSRSWNQAYGAASYTFTPWPDWRVGVRVEGWMPFFSDRVDAWQNGSTRHRKLEDHLGYALLRPSLTHTFGRWATFTITLEGRQHSLSAELRWNTRDECADFLHDPDHSCPGGKRGVSLDLFQLDVVALCFVGRGERLITANEERYNCYAGVGF